MKKNLNLLLSISMACVLSLTLTACSDDDHHHDSDKTPTPTPTPTATPIKTVTPDKTATVVPTRTLTPTPTPKDEFNPNNTACFELGIPKSYKIINGVTCDETKSSIAEIKLSTTTGQGICSGTVITSNTVVTAAHCFDSAVYSVKIIVGGKEYTAVRKAVNPLYGTNPSPSSQYSYDRNDVALVQIDGTFDVDPMPIITSGKANLDETLIVAGYGADENNLNGILKAAYMDVYNTYESGFVLAYDETHTNVCFGDSGGPAFGYANGEIGVYGVTSAGTVSNCLAGDETFFPYLGYSENLNFILSLVSPKQI